MSDERNRRLLEWFEDKAFLGRWISTVEENLVQVIEDAERNLEKYQECSNLSAGTIANGRGARPAHAP